MSYKPAHVLFFARNGLNLIDGLEMLLTRIAEWHVDSVNRAVNMKYDEDYQSSNYSNA